MRPDAHVIAERMDAEAEEFKRRLKSPEAKAAFAAFMMKSRS